MNENDYILASDLWKIITARNCIKEITPSISSIIEKEDYSKVYEILSKWELAHFEELNQN